MSLKENIWELSLLWDHSKIKEGVGQSWRIWFNIAFENRPGRRWSFCDLVCDNSDSLMSFYLEAKGKQTENKKLLILGNSSSIFHLTPEIFALLSICLSIFHWGSQLGTDKEFILKPHSLRPSIHPFTYLLSNSFCKRFEWTFNVNSGY